ncbi:cytochrome P450, partial [Roridomyces roridus]
MNTVAAKPSSTALLFLLNGLRERLQSTKPFTAFFYSLVVAALVSALRQRRRQRTTIPAVTGTGNIFSSYMAGYYYLTNTSDVIQQGYAQYPNAVFRVPTLSRWDYVATAPQHVREIASAPESVLSFADSARDSLESDYTMGPDFLENPYHVKCIRNGLTRNLARTYPDLLDEIVVSLNDVLELQGNEWKAFHVLPNMRQVIARITNRIFIGLPLCRNQEFLDLNINYVLDIFTRGSIIGLLPGFLKPVFGPLISSRKSSLRRQMKFVAPMIEERLANEAKYGPNWQERPNDLITWLLDEARGDERSVPRLANRILGGNLAAIHMTTSAMTAVLFDLVANPEYIQPLREEAEHVVAEEGWSKAALGSMVKIDSFIRESQRLGAASLGIVRRVTDPEGFVFSDGTRLPHGVFVGVPSTAIHYNEANFENASQFDGYRYSRVRKDNENDGEAAGAPTVFNRQMVVTSADHLSWGHGKHGCPGRFLAATEIKTILAHMLINYDIKAEVDGVRPKDVWFGIMRMPSLEGRIMIRKRKVD